MNAELFSYTVQGIAKIRASSDRKECVQAFFQKCRPSWLVGSQSQIDLKRGNHHVVIRPPQRVQRLPRHQHRFTAQG
jgi:hypothetical protein